MSKLLFLTFAFLYMLQIKGQDTTKNKNCDSTIFIQYKSNSLQFIIAGKNIHYQQVFERLNRLKVSANEYKLYKKQSTIGNILLIISAGAIASAGILYKNQDVPKSFSSPINFLIPVGCITISIIQSLKSLKHFNKSVNLYNSEICR